MNFTSLLLCIKTAENLILTPMRSMGQTNENPSVYAVFSMFVLLYHIPLFFSQYLLLSYINQSPCFSNSDTIICKTRRFILSNEFHFSLKDGLWIYLFYSFIEYAPIASKQKGDGGITRHCPFALMYDFILRNIFSCHRSQTQQRRSH